MLANIVSPPTAGTSLATRIVAIGGSARNVSSECQHVGAERRRRLVVAEFDQHRRVFASFGANGCTVSSPNRRPKSIRFSRGDVLVAEDDQLVLDQRRLDRLELRVRQRLAQDRRR